MSGITSAEWMNEIERVGADKTPPCPQDLRAGMGYVKPRGNRWYVNFWRDNREISRVLRGATTREHARDLADKLIMDWDSGKRTPRTDVGGHPDAPEPTVLRGRIYLLNRWWDFSLSPRSSGNRSE